MVASLALLALFQLGDRRQEVGETKDLVLIFWRVVVKQIRELVEELRSASQLHQGLDPLETRTRVLWIVVECLAEGGQCGLEPSLFH